MRSSRLKADCGDQSILLSLKNQKGLQPALFLIRLKGMPISLPCLFSTILYFAFFMVQVNSPVLGLLYEREDKEIHPRSH